MPEDILKELHGVWLLFLWLFWDLGAEWVNEADGTNRSDRSDWT